MFHKFCLEFVEHLSAASIGKHRSARLGYGVEVHGKSHAVEYIFTFCLASHIAFAACRRRSTSGRSAQTPMGKKGLRQVEEASPSCIHSG